MATTGNLVQLLQQLNSNNGNQQQQPTGAPQLNSQSPSLPQQTDQASWVQDLINSHANAGGRLKRTPVGFNFQSIPFDPSSFYRALDTSKTVQQLATQVTLTEAQNKADAERQAAIDASNAAAQRALAGVNPNFTGGTGTNFSGKSVKYKLGHVAPDVAKAGDYFGQKYGIGTEYGVGPGSVPGSDHPHGLAIDFMVYGNKKKGNSLAQDAIKNYKAWNIKYVIWYHYIWHPGRGWSKYSGPSPHTDHVHVSFNS